MSYTTSSMSPSSLNKRASIEKTRKWKDQVHSFNTSQSLQSFYKGNVTPNSSEVSENNRRSVPLQQWARPKSVNKKEERIILKEGYLEMPSAWGGYKARSRSMRRTWEPRYFILSFEPSRDCLAMYYYADVSAKVSDKPLGIIYLMDATLSQDFTEEDIFPMKPKQVFKIIAPKSYTDFGKKEWKDAEHLLACEDEGDVDDWLKVLTTVCKKPEVIEHETGNNGKMPGIQAGIQAVKEGYLEKLSRGKWKLRWFELKDGNLNKYETKNGKLMDSISMISCTLKEYQPEKLPFAFEICCTDNRSIILKADTDTEMHSWLNNILMQKVLEEPRPIRAQSLPPTRSLELSPELNHSPTESLAYKARRLSHSAPSQQLLEVVDTDMRNKLEKKLESWLKLRDRAGERGDMDGVALYTAKIDDTKAKIEEISNKMMFEQKRVKEEQQRKEQQQQAEGYFSLQRQVQSVEKQKKEAAMKEDYEEARAQKKQIADLQYQVNELQQKIPSEKLRSATSPLRNGTRQIPPVPNKPLPPVATEKAPNKPPPLPPRPSPLLVPPKVNK